MVEREYKHISIPVDSYYKLIVIKGKLGAVTWEELVELIYSEVERREHVS